MLFSAWALAYSIAPNQLPTARSGTQNWHVLVDQSGKLGLEEVLSQRQLLQRLDDPSYAIPGSERAIWLQLLIPPQHEPHWISLSAPRIEYLDFYLLQSGRIERQIETGEKRPSSNRPLATLPYLFSVPGDGKPREALIRLQSSRPLVAQFTVMDETGFLNLESNAYLYGALLGALLILSLYNAKRYAFTRYAGHAWVGALHLALLLCAVANIGLLTNWLPNLLYSQSLLADLSALAVSMLLLAFTLRFFNAERHQADGWALRGGLWMLGLQMLAILLNEDFGNSNLIYLSACAAALTAAVVAALRWRAGYGPARMAMGGALILMLGFGGFLASLNGVQPLGLDCPACAILWAAPFAGLSLSFALIERQREIQADRRTHDTVEALNSAELKGRSEFLARISHEIRAPLNGVLGMTELLLGTPLSAKQRDYVQTIRSSGNDLLTMINELLDLPKLESGGIELEDVQFNVPALITDCLDIFRSRAEQQEVELISFIQPAVPQSLRGDPTRLRQILLNLLDNALKQTNEGEVFLGLTVREENNHSLLRITVQDNGRPLQPEEREALLGKLPEREDFVAASARGARIGLLIARQLVALMHGTFGIESDEKSGNILWLDLPLDGQNAMLAQGDGLELLDNSLMAARILIVDDNETCRKVLQQQCASWGMDVSVAASGKEALALLRTKAHLDEFYDAVLLDQEMPGMSGLQLAMRIKEDLNLKHDLLLVMLTGVSRAPSKVVSRNAGIKRILTKPVAGYTLRTTLADELGRRLHPRIAAKIAAVAERPIVREPVHQDFRILVAEDDATSTKVMRGMLNKLDLSPDMVTNGVDALKAIKENHYDLVLMDCEMPLMDGYTATRQLRDWESSQLRPRTPVVALTAHVFSEHRDRAHEAGMDGHMSKPVELSELRELVRFWSEAKAQAVNG